MVRGDPRGLPRLDRRVPHPAVAAALFAGRDAHLRGAAAARYLPLYGTPGVAAGEPLAGGDRVAVRRIERVGRIELTAAARGGALHGGEERVRADRRGARPGAG